MLTSSGGSLNADRGGIKFAKILLTSYVNAPLDVLYCYDVCTPLANAFSYLMFIQSKCPGER